MKRTNALIIGAIVVIILAVGAYVLFHKSPKPASANTSTTSSQTGAAAVNNAVLTTKTNASIGQYLADPSGKTLYTFGGDSTGVSNCTGACLANWPAYQDKGATTGLPTGVSTIKRSDNGQIQFTYNGMPLYYFVSDSRGQVSGDGVENFHVAKPAATTPSSTAPTTSTTPSQTNNSASSGYPY